MIARLVALSPWLHAEAARRLLGKAQGQPSGRYSQEQYLEW